MKCPLLVLCFFVLLSCEQKPSPSPALANDNVVRDSTLLKKTASNPYTPVDVSPMDMLYFPADYTLQKMLGQAAASPVMRVIYSRPHRGGRALFGALVKWGQPWRLGANEATEIQFFQPVTVQGKRIEKGSYVLYAIPYAEKWTVIFNKNIHSWGLKFNPADDVASVDVPVINKDSLVEHFTMAFEKTAAGAELIITWEKTEVRLPIEF